MKHPHSRCGAVTSFVMNSLSLAEIATVAPLQNHSFTSVYSITHLIWGTREHTISLSSSEKKIAIHEATLHTLYSVHKMNRWYDKSKTTAISAAKLPSAAPGNTSVVIFWYLVCFSSCMCWIYLQSIFLYGCVVSVATCPLCVCFCFSAPSFHGHVDFKF